MEFCTIRELSDNKNLFKMSDSLVSIFSKIENHLTNLINQIQIDDLILFKNEGHTIDSIKNKSILNKPIEQSFDLIDSCLYYNEIKFSETNKVSKNTYLFNNHDLILLFDEFISSLENDVLIIWNDRFSSNTIKNKMDFYKNIITDYELKYFNFLDTDHIKKEVQSTNFRLTNNNKKNTIFTLNTATSNITSINTDKKYFLKNKLLLLEDDTYYVFNNTHKKGILVFTIYFNQYQYED